MHLDHDHIAGGHHDHQHNHTHEHVHTHDGVTHSHPHVHEHAHDHAHPHDHEALHDDHCAHDHSHEEGCSGSCNSCGCSCQHTPMEELTALMQYMVGHNAAHAKELADLAAQLDTIGNHTAYEQVMAAVSDFEKGNLRLSTVLASLK